MNTQNPYTAPTASLSTTNDDADEIYEPRIFSFSGRIGRLRYLAYSTGIGLIMMAISLPFMGFMFAGMLGGGDGTALAIGSSLYTIVNIASFVFVVMFGVRRLNDLNCSGWFILLMIIPLINFLLIIYMIFFPGTDGVNKYGPQTVPNTLGVKILGLMFPVLCIVGIIAAIIIPIVATSSV